MLSCKSASPTNTLSTQRESGTAALGQLGGTWASGYGFRWDEAHSHNFYLESQSRPRVKLMIACSTYPPRLPQCKPNHTCLAYSSCPWQQPNTIPPHSADTDTPALYAPAAVQHPDTNYPSTQCIPAFPAPCCSTATPQSLHLPYFVYAHRQWHQ